MNGFLFLTRALSTILYLGLGIDFLFLEKNRNLAITTLLLCLSCLWSLKPVLDKKRSAKLYFILPDFEKMAHLRFLENGRWGLSLFFSIMAIRAYFGGNDSLAFPLFILTLTLTSPMDRLFFAPLRQREMPKLTVSLVGFMRMIGPIICFIVVLTGVLQYSHTKNMLVKGSTMMVLIGPVLLFLRGNPHRPKKSRYANAWFRDWDIRSSDLNKEYFNTLVKSYQTNWLEAKKYWQRLETTRDDPRAIRDQAIDELNDYVRKIRTRKELTAGTRPFVSTLDEIINIWKSDRQLRSGFTALQVYSARRDSGNPTTIMAHVAEYRAMTKLIPKIRRSLKKLPPSAVSATRAAGSHPQKLPPDLRKAVSSVVGILLQRFPPSALPGVPNGDPYFKVIDHIIVMGKNLEMYKDLNDKLNEERYRDYFLPSLNSIYPDYIAKGEVFNRLGKTDILVCDKNGNNILIAECKLWNGEAYLLAGVDQLLNNYINWRDEGTALIIFNRTVRNFSGVIDTATQALNRHPLCQRAAEKRTATSWSYLFQHPNDARRAIRLELILFNFT